MTAESHTLADHPAVDTPWDPFWPRVRAEMRATWERRYRAWMVSWLLVELLILGLYMPAIGLMDGMRIGLSRMPALAPVSIPLLLLGVVWPVLLVWTGAAVLGADLLSLNFRENPEPHREWHPVEFLARAVGRLLPWLLMALLWLWTWVGMQLWAQSMQPAVGLSQPYRLNIGFADQGAGPAGFVLGLLLFSVGFATTAALLSATTRRPRRGRIVLMTGLLMILAAIGNQQLAQTASELYFQQGLVYYLVLWTAETGAVIVLIWRITARRYRRHPNTVGLNQSGSV